MKSKTRMLKAKIKVIRLILKATVIVVTDDWRGGYVINFKID
ncbi:hypothetical protein [Clostridium tagluense]|nr:hypothetical protein [Clostridium tagluense]